MGRINTMKTNSKRKKDLRLATWNVRSLYIPGGLLINILAPTNDSKEEAKDQFYEQLERAYEACPSHHVKLVMGDANAKVGRETVHQPTIGKHSLHESTNENGLRLVDFAAGGQMAIKSTYLLHAQTNPPSNLALPRWAHLQPD
jgi:exonuclease III